MHTYPLRDGPKPHVGGQVTIGCLNGSIAGQPAARVSDLVTCAGLHDAVATEPFIVYIAGRPAARLSHLTSHGGSVTTGYPQVQTD
jgi:uncharacterized Zn-binding protein involved in type VI secretion